jgi:SAM-dependent methyltransferase
MVEHAHPQGHSHDHDGLSPAEYWEQRYAGAGPIWSGRPNAALVALTSRLGSGRAVDLGCGEGGDAIHLAESGWRVTAVDISPTAVSRGRVAADARGLADRIEWIAADLATWQVPDGVELVSACFLQSTHELDRDGILRRAAARLAIGGRLLVVAHAQMPPWSPHAGDPGITPESDLAALALDPTAFEAEVAEIREREARGPDGQPGVLEDSVVLVRRVA